MKKLPLFLVIAALSCTRPKTNFEKYIYFLHQYTAQHGEYIKLQDSMMEDIGHVDRNPDMEAYRRHAMKADEIERNIQELADSTHVYMVDWNEETDRGSRKQ